MILKNLKAIPKTDPSNLIRLRDSVYATDLLITAIGHLDFFSWLDQNPSDLRQITKHFDIKTRPADVMLTLFKSLGLIQENSNGVFQTTLFSKEHLTDNSEWNLIPYMSTQTERPIVEKMLQVLKTGEPAAWACKTDEEDWTRAMEREDFADKFTAGMDSRGAFLAPALANRFDFSKYKSILDIAGASGIYAAAIKSRYPGIRAALFEKPPVDKIALSAIRKRNMEKDIEIFAGDMFADPVPGGFDIHLVSHVLHDWNEDQNRKIIRNSFEHLNPGGIIMIHDAHLNRDKSGPLSVAEYSVLLMFLSYGKCYSAGEMEKLLSKQGFVNIGQQDIAGNRSIITGCKK